MTAPAAQQRPPFAIEATTLLPWVVGALGLAIALAGLLLPWIAPHPPDDVGELVNVIAANSLWLVVGLVVWHRQPGNRVAYLMAAYFLATFIWELTFAPSSVLFTLGTTFADLQQAIFTHIVLAWPTGRLHEPVDRVFVGGVYVYVIGTSIVSVLFWQPNIVCDGAWCPENVLLLRADAALDQTLNVIVGLSVPIIGLCVLALFWRHWTRAGRPARRAMLPIAIALPIRYLFVAIGFPADALGLEAVSSAIGDHSVVANLTLFIFPVAFMIGAVQLRLLRGAVASDILEAGAGLTTRRLEEMLRVRLRDPELQVLRWSSALDTYVDQDGVPVAEDPAGVRSLRRIERDGAPLAAVVHDPVLAEDRSVMAAVTAAVRLALDATELRDELRARGGDAISLPTGEVTFLFGDLEGSTALVRALGQRYGEVLAEVRRIVAEEAHAAGGRVVDAHGDEVFVAFASSVAAVSAAIAVQRRLQDRRWPDGVAIRMRIGLHTGRPERTSSGYFGLDVHRAARIMAAASGGQILASETVVSAGAIEGLARLRSLGSQALRGIEEPVELVEVSAIDGPVNGSPGRSEEGLTAPG